MTQDLRISLIQSDIYWHNPEANLASFEEKIWQITDPTDLILLPEMFNTGYTMATEKFSEHPNGRTIQWMKQMANQTKSVITGSVIIREKDHCYNRLIWADPEGHIRTYDKRHLFRMAEEDKYYTSGRDLLVIELNGWKICPLICYDLRFPAWSRNRYDALKNKLLYDLAVYVANWPAKRINAWDILLKARAFENHCFVAGVNRTGKDGNGVYYNGHSVVVDPKGKEYIEISEDNLIKTTKLSHDMLEGYRTKFPAFLDGDNYEMKN